MADINASDFVPKFLLQAEGEDLRYGHFPKRVGNFALKASFGQGTRAVVPWISITGPGMSTSKGYYPVFLYYRSLRTLVLALGISETFKLDSHWPQELLETKEPVSTIFPAGETYRYGDSWIYEAYDVTFENGEVFLSQGGVKISTEEFDRAFDELLEQYALALKLKGSEDLVGFETSKEGKTMGKTSADTVSPGSKQKRPTPEVRERLTISGPKNTQSLGQVVAGYSRLSVEDYQRTYQWSAEQIDELWNDLLEAVDTGEAHFFGTLILQGTESSIATVVDGQQRLTTIFVIISALRDEIRKLEIDSIEPRSESQMTIRVLDLTHNFLYSSNHFSDQRFVSNRGIRQLLAECVIAEPKGRRPLPEREVRVTLPFRKAVNHVRLRVETDLEHYETEDDKLRRIYNLFIGLTEQFKVLRLETSDLSESLEIFLTLNNRGMPLGPSDIVRGQIMQLLGKDRSQEEQESIQARIFNEWEQIVEYVGDPEIFLRHYLVATKPKKIQKKKIVDEVFRSYRPSPTEPPDPKLAEEFWAGLIVAAEKYGSIVNPEATSESGYFISLLEHLAKSQRIMLLGILLTPMEKRDQEELTRLTFVIAFRWVIGNQNAQKLEDFFQEQCQALGDEGVDQVVENIKEKASAIPVSINSFLENEGDSSFVTRALLHAIHRGVHRRQEDIEFNNKKFHLEHIAPQTPTDHWFNEILGEGERDTAAYDRWVRRAGNLILLDKKLNSGALQKPFSEKVTSYYKDATFFALTNDLKKLKSWRRSEIEERTHWLGEMFEILWSIDKSKEQPVSFLDWRRQH